MGAAMINPGARDRVKPKEDASIGDEHALLLAIVGGVTTLATFLFMLFAQFGGWLAGAGISGLIVFAGISIGGFLGFLFSVPRILAKDSAAPLAPPVAAVSSSGASVAPATVAVIRRERLLRSNTNLERISEWLTTMLVGVGLTRVGSLGEAFAGFSKFLSSNARVFDVEGKASAGVLPAIGPFLLVCGLVSGFIFFYIYTRIYLSMLFQRVEDLFADEPGAARLDNALPEFKDAAASLARNPSNAFMAYASTASEISVNDSLYIIQNLLYRPDGYLVAIELGNKLTQTPAVKMARYWFLMAAAYGQRHHMMVEQQLPELDRVPVRGAVLDAARKAAQLDPAFKQSLRALTRVNTIDNDLQDFATDPDFLQIVK
jgi:hypothetical protein